MNMRRLAQCLAGDQVLVLSAHQPVLHQAGCLHRHIVLQPAAVPGLEVTVMTQQNQRLYLGGGGSRGMGSAPSLWRPTHPPQFPGILSYTAPAWPGRVCPDGTCSPQS